MTTPPLPETPVARMLDELLAAQHAATRGPINFKDHPDEVRQTIELERRLAELKARFLALYTAPIAAAALTERSPEATAPTVVQETPDPMLSIPGVKKIGAHYYCICNLPEKILEFVTEIWSEPEQRWRPLTSNERIQLDVDMMSPAPSAPAA